MPILAVGVWVALSLTGVIVPPADVWKPTQAEGYWAMVAAFSAIVVGFAACFGLQSLWLTRLDITLRHERECRSCAVDRCRELAEQIIPDNQALRARWAAAQITKLPLLEKLPLVHRDTDALYLPRSKRWVEALPKEIHVESTSFLNRLETWAAYFMHGLADLEVGFRPCAAVYTTTVLQFYPLLIATRADSAAGRYPNTVGLYRKWKRKLSDDEMDMVRRRLDSMFPGSDDPDDDDAPEIRGLGLDE